MKMWFKKSRMERDIEYADSISTDKIIPITSIIKWIYKKIKGDR